MRELKFSNSEYVFFLKRSIFVLWMLWGIFLSIERRIKLHNISVGTLESYDLESNISKGFHSSSFLLKYLRFLKLRIIIVQRLFWVCIKLLVSYEIYYIIFLIRNNNYLFIKELLILIMSDMWIISASQRFKSSATITFLYKLKDRKIFGKI